MIRFALPLILIVPACAAIPQKPPFLSGQWGGPHVGALFEGGLARLDYDCATGTIDEAVAPGPDGAFRAKGTHVPGQGGPIRVGQIFVSHKATYRGRVDKDVMELTATLDDGTVIGPFTLKKGAEPQIVRCL